MEDNSTSIFHPDSNQLLSVDYKGRRAVYQVSSSVLTDLTFKKEFTRKFISPQAIKGTNWFIYAFSSSINFISSDNELVFKKFTAASFVGKLSDMRDNQYIAAFHTPSKLSIFDRSLLDGNTVYLKQILIGGSCYGLTTLGDHVRVALLLTNNVKVYEIMDPAVGTGIYDMGEHAKDSVSLADTQYLAVVGPTKLVVLDWTDTSNPTLSWTKSLAIEGFVLDVREGS